MKLASLKNDSRDGKLVVVTTDLSRCRAVPEIARTLQTALDNWKAKAPLLAQAARELNSNANMGEPYREENAHSPLPRAFQWADGSAYVNHVELVRKARKAEMPASFWTDPLMYQGGSDNFLAPHDPIAIADEAYGIDMEGEIAVIIDDVPMGADLDQAAASVRLIMIANDVSLRGLIPAELGKGFGFFHAKPSSAFSPVAVTPDELGPNWQDSKLTLPLLVDYNGSPFGKANAGIDMTFNFAELIRHAAKTRPLCAGTIIGSGTVSNKLEEGPGKAISEGGAGYACIAEIRMIETIETGAPITPFMKFGDTVRIEMLDAAGNSIFGAIQQTVEKYTPSKTN